MWIDEILTHLRAERCIHAGTSGTFRTLYPQIALYHRPLREAKKSMRTCVDAGCGSISRVMLTAVDVSVNRCIVELQQDAYLRQSMLS